MCTKTSRVQRIKNHLAANAPAYFIGSCSIGMAAFVIIGTKAGVNDVVDLRISTELLKSMQETKDSLLFDIPEVGNYMLTYVPNHG